MTGQLSKEEAIYIFKWLHVNQNFLHRIVQVFWSGLKLLLDVYRILDHRNFVVDELEYYGRLVYQYFNRSQPIYKLHREHSTSVLKIVPKN